MLTYSFENIGEESLYSHLYKCIRADILSGSIAPGEKLPSKRSFAENLGVSVVTVENAYAQLISEGYIYALPKKGFFAAEIEQSTVHPPVLRNEAARSPEKRRIQPCFADFSGNRTDPRNFPFAAWAKLMRETISEKSADLMTNAPSGGVTELRQAIAAHLYAFRGIQADPDCIIVGAGTEYLYGLLIQLLGFDKVYALEDPGYRKVGQVFRSMGVQCVYAAMDKDGVVPASLVQSGAEILHISPSHHFPTGIVTPAARRYALLRWAVQSENRYIIEDDYDSEFRLAGKPIPALQSMDAADRVIYMNTFTKSLASTIRIGYMVLPPALAEKFRQKLGFYACTVSNLEQYTLAKFISEGHFEKHLNRMRTRYKLKKDILLQEMSKSGLLDMAEIREEKSGLHFLLRLKERVKAEAVLTEALARDIRITSISAYYHMPSSNSKTAFVISYSDIPDERIPEAVQRLTAAVRAAYAAK